MKVINVAYIDSSTVAVTTLKDAISWKIKGLTLKDVSPGEVLS